MPDAVSMLFLSRSALVAILFCALLLASCSSQEELVFEARSAPVDLTGSWEMNYGRSDHVEHRLNSLAREYRRDMERQQRAAQMDRSLGGMIIAAGENTRREFNAVLASARLADMITRSQVVTIEQDPELISVARDENFSLVCDPTRAPAALDADSLGMEHCYWDGTDLLYRIRMPAGLRIDHRFTLAPAADQLRIATTVSADGAAPFTLNRFYYRFEAPEEDYDCTFTLSRGTVCSRGNAR